MNGQQPDGPGNASPYFRIPIWLVLAVVFGTLAAFAVAVTAWRFHAIAVATATTLLNDIGQREIQALETELRAGLDPALQQVGFLSGYLASGKIGMDDDQRIGDLLMGSLAASPQLEAVTFIRDDLHVIVAARAVDGRPYEGVRANGLYDSTTRRALQVGREMKGSGWGAPVFVPELGKPLMSALGPVRVGGRFIGVFTAVVSLPAIARQLVQRYDPRGAVPFVLAGDGGVLAHHHLTDRQLALSVEHPLPDYRAIDDPVLAAFVATALDPATLSLATGGTTGQPQGADLSFEERVVEVAGARHLVLYRIVRGITALPLIIGAHLPMSVIETVFDTLTEALQRVAFVIAAAVAFSLVLGRFIGRPVRALAQATRQLAALDFSGAPVLGRSRLTEIDIAAAAYNTVRAGLGWFATYVPQSLVPQLMRPDSSEALASREVEVSVLFTDIVGFSAIAQRQSPSRLAAFLNRHFSLLGQCIAAQGGSIDKYIGDSVMAFWGAPDAQPDHAARAARAALAIAEGLAGDNERRLRKGLAPVRIRIGIHSGTAIAGNIGAPGRINYTLVGDTVNIAQRLEQFGKRVDDGRRSAVISVSADAASRLPPEMPLTRLGSETLPGRSSGTEIYRLG